MFFISKPLDRHITSTFGTWWAKGFIFKGDNW